MPRSVERVLMLAPRWPLPALRGYERRTLELLRVLRDRAEVRLIAFGGGEALPFDGTRAHGVHRSPVSTLAGNARSADPLLPAQVRLYLDARMRAAVAEEVRSFRPDVVSAILARMAPYLALAGDAHRHVDLIDALSLNMQRRAAESAPPLRAALALEGRLMRRYEERAVQVSDSATLVAEADRRAAPWLDSCAVVPMGVNLESLPFRSAAGRDATLLFFGNLGYFPNIEAARVVAEEVLPRVRREVPDATLRIVGARPAAAVQRLDALEGVTVVGPVESMVDSLHAAAVAVVPVYTGSGMKTKVTEAMAAGTPVVANAMAMEGIDGARAGVDHLCGEDPGDMAAHCVRLLGDPAARENLARAGRELVEARFAWGARADDLLRLWSAG
jgi:glycosyltransferase involved in cell wall biosynthesis